MFKKPLTDGDNSAALIKGHGIARAYAAMHYDAVAVSGSDLTAGMRFFDLYPSDLIPWISANIYKKNGELLFAGHVVKDLGNLTVGIIGLTGQREATPAGITVGDWMSALDKEVGVLEQRCDMLIVLSNLPDMEHKKIIDTFPQIDLLITTSRRSGNSEPKISGNCLITQSGSRGKYIGKLDIEWSSAGKWQPDTTQSLTLLKRRLSSIERQVEKLRQQEKKQPGGNRQKLERMSAYQKTVEAQVEQMTRENIPIAHASANRFKSLFLPIRPSTQPAAVQQIVREIKKSVNSLNRSRSRSMSHDPATTRLALQLDTIGDYNQCRQCHADQVAFWQKTGHAMAFNTLDRRGQSFNLDCLPCHVTGGSVDQKSSEEDRQLLLALPEYRKNIGCGTCHGQTARHLRAPEPRTLTRIPPRELCTRCHTAERDDNFYYTSKLALISCPAGE